RRRHTRFSRDWSSDVCSSDLSFIRIYLNCLRRYDIPLVTPVFLEREIIITPNPFVGIINYIFNIVYKSLIFTYGPHLANNYPGWIFSFRFFPFPLFCATYKFKLIKIDIRLHAVMLPLYRGIEGNIRGSMRRLL